MTPAFDLAPQQRSGESGAIAMPWDRDGNRIPNWPALINACHLYGMTRNEAHDLLDVIRSAIEANWADACEFAQITKRDQQSLWGRQFLNPATFYNA